MTKLILVLIILLIATAFLYSFNYCQDKSREELIIGKWEMDKKEYPRAQMSLLINKDKTLILDRIVNGLSTFKQLYSYNLTDNNKFIIFEPFEKGKKIWNVEIIQLDYKVLTLRSQSPDSSLLFLKRQNE